MYVRRSAWSSEGEVSCGCAREGLAGGLTD